MTTSEGTTTLSDLIASEVRAMIGRKGKGWSQARLAREMAVTPAWLNYRLTGVQEIGTNDLQRIAAALGVPVVALLPRSVLSESGVTVLYPQMTERAPRNGQRPPDHRPSGRRDASGKPEHRRTARIPRPEHGKAS